MKQKLRIGGVPEHFNLPWKQASADGAFSAAGFDVEFIDYPGGTGAMNAALRNRDLDAALLLTEGAVLDILSGSDNRLVSVYVNSPLVWGIHVATSSRIQSVDDIQGKRFAISRYGSGSHLIATVDAAERGFDVTAMEFVVVDNIDGARAALADGRADVFLWEKHMTQPLVDQGEFRRIGERVVPWPAFVVSARLDYLSGHGQLVDSALTIVSEYADRLKASADAAKRIADTYNIAFADAESWLSGVQWSRSRRYPADAMDRVATALRTLDMIVTSDPAQGDIWYTLPQSY